MFRRPRGVEWRENRVWIWYHRELTKRGAVNYVMAPRSL
jgi:hypothetical protein